MMASRFLRGEKETKHSRFHEFTERGFNWMLRRYERGLDLVLRHQSRCVRPLAQTRFSVTQPAEIQRGMDTNTPKRTNSERILLFASQTQSMVQPLMKCHLVISLHQFSEVPFQWHRH
jgi:hypothetical protein